ncbi:cupin domain-containing protein [Aquabacter spiritensis]|uniref:Mannose-6-phosphate isomerase-like protein (Cupin superfamily) n=1 Tax=Aquabacter spiritensis TaxID=933073 RepID=A0A4R3LZI5_9HYPH|nr:cupin domain-containing protein [Aquabacter spiritensis]TCT06171.1 mannose-6-phosphate isomerase-like protein (cupin superfamily) [Aquabacter spiritensis]
MARVVRLADLPGEEVAAGVAGASVTAGETRWMDAKVLRLAAGATLDVTVPAGSDGYLFVVRGAVRLTVNGTDHDLALQASAVIEEGTTVALANMFDGESELLQVLAPPQGVASGLAGFGGGLDVRPRDQLPLVVVPEQKKKRFYIVSKEASKSQRGHAMIVEYERDTVTALHHHPDAESMFLLLDGAITFVVDGKEVVVRPGDATVFRAGDVHSLRCAEGVTEASFLEFHIPAAFTTVKE